MGWEKGERGTWQGKGGNRGTIATSEFYAMPGSVTTMFIVIMLF